MVYFECKSFYATITIQRAVRNSSAIHVGFIGDPSGLYHRYKPDVMRRQRDIIDYPTLTMTEAAVVFNRSRVKFSAIFDEYLSETIRWEETEHGRLLLAVDVYSAAYPEANSQTVHLMVQQHVFRLRDTRVVNRAKRGKNGPSNEED